MLAAISTNEAVFVGSASFSDEVASNANVHNWFETRKPTLILKIKPFDKEKFAWLLKTGESSCEDHDIYIFTRHVSDASLLD